MGYHATAMHAPRKKSSTAVLSWVPCRLRSRLSPALAALPMFEPEHG